jgi:type II secretory pathway predicted ATPase ExeA
MFERYFKLVDQPFGATPDPRFFLRTESHREALASLYAGFYANRGFTVLIAEPGMGKTTLLFEFLDQIRAKARTVFLFDTLCEPKDVLSLILQDLGLTPGENAVQRRSQLNEILAAEACADRKIVVVIDEAQNLSLEALEAVRLLSNFETSRSKLIQVILSGQPQLADKLERPEVVQLRQRISTICHLTRFTAAETNAYIEHRLKLAGYIGGPIFTSSALQLLEKASRGIPRVINTLCFNSLCLCLASNRWLVDEPTMFEAICDLQLVPSSSAASTFQTRREMPAPTPPNPPDLGLPPEFSEVQLSSGGTARYAIAALLALCITVVGASWRPNRDTGHDLHSSLAAVHTIWQAARTGQGKNTSHPEPLIENTATPISAQSKPGLIGSAQPEEVIRPKQIVVAPGESLETIARTHLGTYDSHILRQIRALNPNITDPNHIEIGRTVRLPRPRETDKAKASLRSHP